MIGDRDTDHIFTYMRAVFVVGRVSVVTVHGSETLPATLKKMQLLWLSYISTGTGANRNSEPSRV